MKIGDDEIGNKIVRELKEKNVKIDKFSIINKARTPIDFVKITSTGNRIFHYFSDKNLERSLPKKKDFEKAKFY